MADDRKAKEDGNDNSNFPKDLVGVEVIARVATVGVAWLSPTR